MAALPPELPPPHRRKLVIRPDDPIGAAANAVIASALEAFKAEQAGAIAGEVEAIHQLRVASRRLRAAILLLGSVLNANRTKAWRRDLQWVAAAAGAVREPDVAAEVVRVRTGKLPPDLAGSLEPFYDELARRRLSAHLALTKVLASPRYHTMLQRLEVSALRKIPAGATVGPAAVPMLRSLVRSVTQAGARLGEAAPAELFHRARVRIKRLRYALEMFATLGGKSHRKLLRRLEELQELLGMHNDVIAAATWLRTFAASPGTPPASILAAGALVQSLTKRERKLALSSLVAWRRLVRKNAIGAALAEIRRNGERQFSEQTESVIAS